MHGSERGTGDAQAGGVSPENAYWAGIYEQYHKQVRASFAQSVPCSHDVDDLVQDVFTSLIRRGHILRDPRPYVRAATRHRLWAYWRRRKKSGLMFRYVAPELLGEDCAGLPDRTYGSNPLRELEKQELERTVRYMMNRLTPALAEVLKLHFIDGLPPSEMAARTGHSREAMKKRLSRAKHSLLGLYGT